MKIRYLSLLITLLSGFCHAEMTAIEILERYDQNQQGQKSRNVYMQTFRESMDSFLETPPPNLKTESRFITDGVRMDFLWERWDRFGNENTPLDEVKSNKIHYVCDGDKYYNYRERNRTLQILDQQSYKGKTYYNAYPGAVSEGFFSGDFKSFSEILRHNSTQIDAKKIDSDGNTLYFIEADTPYGHYKIYFDPQHGFNVVKAELRKTGNDICYGEVLNEAVPEGAVGPRGHPLSPRKELVMTLSNNEFKQVDDCWIPADSNWEVQITHENGRVWSDKYKSKKTSIELNPDFEAINAFVPNFPNNTKVAYIGKKSPVPLVWLNGKVVVNVDSDEEETKKQATKPSVRGKREPIYDVNANAEQQIADALVKAKQNNKHVLLVYGGNWCSWCYKLHDCFTENTNIKKLLQYEYELVMVDTTSNKSIQKRFNANPDSSYPYLTVLDAEGKVLVNQATEPLEEGKSHNPDKVYEFLAKWMPKPLNADEVYEEALALAERENKRVFLHFGAPWCGWCHRLEDFLARPEIAKVVAHDYILVKIDLERTAGAKAFDKRIRLEGGGVPWFAIFDAKGKLLISSVGPQGNIGYPVKPSEIAHFIRMISETAQNITSEQISVIEKTLSQEQKN